MFTSVYNREIELPDICVRVAGQPSEELHYYFLFYINGNFVGIRYLFRIECHL